MTLDQLRIFVTVAEHQHVTKAAAELHLTQSAVSGAIAALEKRHAVQLFERMGRRIALNETGRIFLLEARSVLSRASAAERALADLSGLRRGRLGIRASQTIAGYWLPPRLVAFQALHPGVELDLGIGNTREVARAVADGTAELGFVEGEVSGLSLSLEEIGADRLVVLVRPSHPWASRKQLSAEDLMREPWVLREEGSGTRSTLVAGLAKAGVRLADLRVVLSLPSNEAVLAAAAAGGGATALSQSAAAAALAAGYLVRAPFAFSPRTYYLVRHRERFRSRAADAFVATASSLPKGVTPAELDFDI